MPDSLTAQNTPEMLHVVADLRQLHHELSQNPFEYVSDATRAEHHDLAKLFTRLMQHSSEIVRDAFAAFRAGSIEFKVAPELIEVRNQLTVKARGQSATAMLLTKFFSGTETSSGEARSEEAD